MRILKNDSKGMAKVRLLDLINVYSIITDLTVLNIIETIDQVSDRCLSCAGEDRDNGA